MNKAILLFLTFFHISTFIILSIIITHDLFRQIDFDSLIRIQSSISNVFDLPFSILTLLGSSEITVILVLLIFFWILQRKKTYFFGIFIFILIYVVELLGKLLIYHPKPLAIYNRYAFDFHFPSSFIVETSFSFPSGHMARISFLACILFFFIIRSKATVISKIILINLILVIIVSVFISRIYLAEHWLSDVIGGLILGQMIGLISLLFL